MPHKCVWCGKEYEDSSIELLEGCSKCGGKKFIYIRSVTSRPDVREEKPIPSAKRKEIQDEPGTVSEDGEKEDLCDSLESIRIVSPGKYVLDIQKLAQSDERVVGFGKNGNYALDLHSMARSKKDRKKQS